LGAVFDCCAKGSSGLFLELSASFDQSQPRTKRRRHTRHVCCATQAPNSGAALRQSIEPLRLDPWLGAQPSYKTLLGCSPTSLALRKDLCFLHLNDSTTLFNMGFLRVCCNIFPLLFALASLAFAILVCISGTSSNNQLADIYFMRVLHLLLSANLMADEG